ncbi:MAG TPA: CoA-binding protein [Dehalococcoidia bacterium]|nr:CoA-binding protein [Dehalococcoidia bacterium]
MTDRIPLQRSVAVVGDEMIVVKPSGRFFVPMIQVAITGGAVLLIIWLLNNNGSIIVMMLALLVAMLLGPVAVLGFVYNFAGSAVIIDRTKQSVTLQQGFLGLGIGTAELVPFSRIGSIEVAGDADEELSSGELQDVVHWDLLIVKDNEKVMEIGTITSLRQFAGEGLERANRLARAIAEMTEATAVEAVSEGNDEPIEAEPAVVAPRRRVERGDRRPVPGRADAVEEDVMDRAVEVMGEARTIAVVGVSESPSRDSHDVARYLIEAGYEVYLVNPTLDQEVLGRRVYDSVQELPEAVDIVDVFRRSEHVSPVVDDAIEAGAKVVWMQLGIVNEEAAERAREAGLEVVMDRCTKIEHRRLLAEA